MQVLSPSGKQLRKRLVRFILCFATIAALGIYGSSIANEES